MTSFSKAKNSDTIAESIEANITSLGARATTTINSFNSGSVNLEMTFRILRTDFMISVNGWTLELADGPLIIGMMERKTDSNAVTARLITVNGPIEPNDDDAKDITNDRVWILATFSGHADRPGQHVMGSKNIRWTFPVGADSAGWNYFVTNASGSAMNVESKAIKIIATHYGVWVK